MNETEEMTNLEDPASFQPPNSNFEASDVEACRICLVTGVKMYSLQDTNLGRCMDSITGFNKSYTGLPNYICYQCAPCLIKCHKLIEKSKTAQATMQDIFAKNGQITKTLIEEQNRSQLNIVSPLDSYLLLNYHHVKYDDENYSSKFIETNTDSKGNVNIKLNNETKNESSDEETELLELLEEAKALDGVEESEMNSDDDVEEIRQDIPVVEIISDDENIGDDFISLKSYQVKIDKRSRNLISQQFQKPLQKFQRERDFRSVPKAKGKNKKRKYSEPLSPLEAIMQKYFKIDELPIPQTNTKKYTCNKCRKMLYNIYDAKNHRFSGCKQHQSSNNGVISRPKPAKASQPRIWTDWSGNH